MRKLNRKWDEPMYDLVGELVFLSGAFLLGAVLGSFFASGFSRDGQLYQRILEVLPFKIFLFFQGGLLLLVFLSAIFPIGRLAAPFAIAVEGAWIAVSVTCYIGFYGVKGYWPALAAWWFTGTAMVLLLLILGCQASLYTKQKGGSIRHRQGRSINRRNDRNYWLCGGIVFCLLPMIGWIHCRWMAELSSFLQGRIG